MNFPFRADIEALRGVAVLAVVIFHLFPNILPGGYAGVDIFFCNFWLCSYLCIAC